MHALLFRGRVRAEIRGRSIDLGECHPVLVAERLVELARRAFDAWERGLALHARGEASGLLVGVRVSADGELALTLGGAHGSARRTVHTFPALGVVDVLEAALAFGRSLVRAILRRDRTQSANLRLGALRRTLRESTEALRRASQSDSKINDAPERYRAFAASTAAIEQARRSSATGAAGAAGAAGPSAAPASSNLAAARLRYAARWRAIVPGIDLRATYLCGDRVIVGAATEMWALDRANGRVLWRTDTTRGTSVVTPGGIARLAPDGRLAVHDFGTGEPSLKTRIAPRVGGPVAGAVVHLPGLPRLVVVTEGEHHLVAVDLTNGEPRWRWSWGAARGPRAAPRMKRAGRLVYVTSGDGALTALDVMTGAVVWRLRDRLRFQDASDDRPRRDVHRLRRCPRRRPPLLHRPLLGARALDAADRRRQRAVHRRGSASRGGRVGGRRRPPEERPRARRVPPRRRRAGHRARAERAGHAVGCPDGHLVAGGRRRVHRQRADGRARRRRRREWRALVEARARAAPTRGGPSAAAGARLALRRALRALLARHGRRTRRARRGAGRDGASERGERSGELVAGISILRPSDGATLGTIAPTEAIPDLLRVDERCDVYVAEDSGHLIAFGALPRLSLLSSPR